MATVKIVLRKKANKDGTYPLTIRITKDRRTSFIHLGKHLNENQWDSAAQRVKKSHPNSARLNNYLIKKLAEANDHSLDLETQKTQVSSNTVKQRIKPKAGITFLRQAELYLDNLKIAGKYNQYTPDKSRISHFSEFLKKSDIAFSDITISLLERFKSFLKSEYQIGDRSVVNHLVVIRSVFRQAINDHIVDEKHYPFGKGKMSIKFPDSTKLGLTSEELKRLEEVELSNQNYNHARNLWLFAYYFAGIRISDVLRLKWSDFQDGRLHYVMGKNAKGDSLKIPVKALKILEQYKQDKIDLNDFVFPDLKEFPDIRNKFLVQRKIAFTTSRYDKFLRKFVAPAAKIEKPLTMHIARHTFGNLSGDKIPIQMLQKLYRHSSITTTIGYQANFLHKNADEALDAVIGI
jgi:integrase/recombinase XerD